MLLNNATKQCERALAVLECAFTNIIGFQGSMHFETRTTKNGLTGGQRMYINKFLEIQIYLHSFSDILFFLEYLTNRVQQALVKQSKMKLGFYNYISTFE